MKLKHEDDFLYLLPYDYNVTMSDIHQFTRKNTYRYLCVCGSFLVGCAIFSIQLSDIIINEISEHFHFDFT